MRIGIDGNEANIGQRVGIGEYAFELLRQFSIYEVPDIKYQIYLRESPGEDLPKEGENWQYRVIGLKRLWTQIALPLDLYSHKPRPDVFFTPTHYAPRFCPVPTAVSVMDLSYIHFPKLFRKKDLYQLKNWTAYSVKKAKRIFTISKATKDDIIAIYGVAEAKVVVTYPGIKMQKGSIKSRDFLQRKYAINGKYILFVGTLQPRKNISRLIEAFSMLGMKDITLVVAGKRGWLFEDILSAPEKFGVNGRVLFLDFVPDEDLPTLYANAACFVLPSLYEGFGLPVLEAMRYGCPTIISKVSSLPEVGGEAALYIDPNDAWDLKEKIERLLTDEKLREYLIKKGKEQVKKFSWEKTTKETLAVLEEMASGII
jgi:glycosyltransferase involved in cell wall biosynthesis